MALVPKWVPVTTSGSAASVRPLVVMALGAMEEMAGTGSSSTVKPLSADTEPVAPLGSFTCTA